MFQSGTGFKSIILKRYHTKRKRLLEYIVDETLIKVGSEYIWLWVAIEPKNREILALNISKERNMFVAERFIAVWSRFMENILYQQMEELGIHRPVGS